MKKGLTALLPAIGIAALLMPGCNGNSQTGEYMHADDSLVIYTPDTAFYGHLGEGTGMSCLELVTDNGDTLLLNKTDEDSGEDGLILGAIANYTDRFTITTRNDNQSVLVALNISQLQQKWQSGSNKENGFYLNQDGTAKALSEGQYKYNKWRLCNCQLIMLRESEGVHGSETRNDTLNILELTPDSLVMQEIHTNTPETFYHIQ